jgi:hypothetical protein
MLDFMGVLIVFRFRHAQVQQEARQSLVGNSSIDWLPQTLAKVARQSHETNWFQQFRPNLSI